MGFKVDLATGILRVSPDGFGLSVLTAEELCDICDVTLAQRQTWAKEGDVRQRRGFEELDVIELASYARLRAVAGPKRAKAAWRDLRSELRSLLLQRTRRLWVVIQAQGIVRHTIVVRASDLAKRVDNGDPVVVIELRQRIEAARGAYREATTELGRRADPEIRQLKSSG
jgi:hypothetical protein